MAEVAAIATIAANPATFPATALNRALADEAVAAVEETVTTADNRAIFPVTAPNPETVAAAAAVEEVATCNATSAKDTVTCPASARHRNLSLHRDGVVFGFGETIHVFSKTLEP